MSCKGPPDDGAGSLVTACVVSRAFTRCQDRTPDFPTLWLVEQMSDDRGDDPPVATVLTLRERRASALRCGGDARHAVEPVASRDHRSPKMPTAPARSWRRLDPSVTDSVVVSLAPSRRTAEPRPRSSCTRQHIVRHNDIFSDQGESIGDRPPARGQASAQDRAAVLWEERHGCTCHRSAKTWVSPPPPGCETAPRRAGPTVCAYFQMTPEL